MEISLQSMNFYVVYLYIYSRNQHICSVLKINKVNENRPRTLYIDLKHRTLTIHDPTGKGKKKGIFIGECRPHKL